MNIMDKLFDLYLDTKFKVEDVLNELRYKFYDWKDGVQTGCDSYVDGHGDVFEVEKKPKKKKKKSTKKKKK